MSNSDPFSYWEESFQQEAPPTINVKELDDLSLLDLFRAQKETLLELKEVLSPTSQAGRDAHSLYGACKIELTRRGLI